MKSIIKKALKQGYEVYEAVGTKGEKLNWIYVSNGHHCIFIGRDYFGRYTVSSRIKPKLASEGTGQGFEITSTFNKYRIDLAKCFLKSQQAPSFYKVEHYEPATIEEIAEDYKKFGWRLECLK